MRSAERGVALLEVLAAVAILAIAGLATIELVATQARALTAAAAREVEMADASRLLTAHALLTRSDLERRLGSVRTGPWLVEVERPAPRLFRIGLRHADHPDVEALVTVVYREPADAQ